MERAIFAGGCFWCMIQPFDTLPGIHTIMSGYTGGHVPSPTYEQVKSKTTGHTEAVEIIYDPEKISYQELVEIYWQQTDPTDAFGQFEDRGENYRPVIYFTTNEQKSIKIIIKKILKILSETMQEERLSSKKTGRKECESKLLSLFNDSSWR